MIIAGMAAYSATKDQIQKVWKNKVTTKICQGFVGVMAAEVILRGARAGSSNQTGFGVVMALMAANEFPQISTARIAAVLTFMTAATMGPKKTGIVSFDMASQGIKYGFKVTQPVRQVAYRFFAKSVRYTFRVAHAVLPRNPIWATAIVLAAGITAKVAYDRRPQTAS